MKEKSSAIHYEKCGEWTDALRDILQQKVHDAMSMRSILTLDASEIGPDPGEYFLDTLYLSGNMPPRKRKTPVERLAEPNSPMGDYIIWITGIMDAETDDRYETFVSDYLKQAKRKAVFILETEYEGKKPSKAMIASLEWQNQVTHSDLYLFAMNSISGIRMNETMKQYASELAAALCGKDPELCMSLLKNVRSLIRTPEETVCRIASEYPDCFQDKDAIAKIVWEMQIKIFYPFIEKKRMDLVEQYASQIRAFLPLRNSIGESINDPELVEIGAIKFMKDMSKIQMQQSDAIRTDELWKMRNALSHLKTISYDDITTLCEG